MNICELLYDCIYIQLLPISNDATAYTWVMETNLHADIMELSPEGKCHMSYCYIIWVAKYLSDGSIGERNDWKQLLDVPTECEIEFAADGRLCRVTDAFNIRRVQAIKDSILFERASNMMKCAMADHRGEAYSMSLTSNDTQAYTQHPSYITRGEGIVPGSALDPYGNSYPIGRPASSSDNRLQHHYMQKPTVYNNNISQLPPEMFLDRYHTRGLPAYLATTSPSQELVSDCSVQREANDVVPALSSVVAPLKNISSALAQVKKC